MDFITFRKICKPRVVYSFECIEDIQILGMNMPFISSCEAKNAYFMTGEATNEIYFSYFIHGKATNKIYFFLLHEMK